MKATLSKQQGADGVQRVEPAAGLVDRLADEIRRELCSEGLLVFEGIVPLGHGHRARVEPDIDQLGDALHLARLAALRAGKLDLVDIRPVQVQARKVTPGQLGKLGDRANRNLVVAALALPDRQRRAPVALATQRPIDVVLQPVAKAPVLDVPRHPVDLLVQLDQAVFELAGADVPGAAGIVQQRRVAAPAEGVGVGVGAGAEEQAARLQVLDDQRVGVFDELPAPGAHLGDEGAVIGRPSSGPAGRIPSAACISSAPKAGAMCTRPVPSSVVTKSSSTT